MFIFKKKNSNSRKGFTLMELLIYSGILIISAGLIAGIIYTVNRYNQKMRVEEELNNQMMILEELFRQKIQAAKSVYSIGGPFLSLEMKEEGKNPTSFLYENDVVSIQEGKGSFLALNNKDKIKVTSLSFIPTGPGVDAGTVDILTTNHYAWSGNVGWIDFAAFQNLVQVPVGAGELLGFAYILSDESWISLNCESTNSCDSVDYKVESDEQGNLTGWAWSESYGWISFSCLSDNTCSSSDYGVSIDEETGEFDGYAWSENIGWISFNCKTGGEGQSDICHISDYKVQSSVEEQVILVKQIVTPTNHYAWSDNIGWIDFAYPGGNFQVSDETGELLGFAYILSDESWISLNCESTNSCDSVDYKVESDEQGNLTGWAWSESYGWISFSCMNDNSCSISSYGVSIDEETGEFDGYAWSENIGWISFNCETGGEDQNDICHISDYKVQNLVARYPIAIKIDITLEYNSPKPELNISKSNTFIFNILNPVGN